MAGGREGGVCVVGEGVECARDSTGEDMNIHRAFRPRRNSISGGIIGRCPTQSAERAATSRETRSSCLPSSTFLHVPLAPFSLSSIRFAGKLLEPANLEYDLRKTRLAENRSFTIKYRNRIRRFERNSSFLEQKTRSQKCCKLMLL